MSACGHSGSGTLDSPPPAYEYSEQDYDKKLAEATEQSLRFSEHQNRSSMNAHILHEEDWNERQISTKLPQDKSFQSRSNASLEPVRPLNIKKKKSRASTTSLDITNEKEKPSWYNEAQLGGASAAPTSSTTQRRALPIPGAHQRPLSAQNDYRREYNEEAKSSPLSFTAVNKSLDGPSYERFSSDKATGPVMMLHGEHRALSPPLPSRSASPITNAQIRSRAVTPQSGSISNGYHYAQQPTSFQPRSSGKQQTAFNQSAPRMNFDPSVAYENTKASSTRYSKLPTESYEDKAQNAAALYSSAVAPLMSQKSMPSSAPKVKRYDSSSTSAPPEYTPETAIQGLKTNQFYAQQDFAGSRMSVYSQSSVNSGRVAQYPVQQAYGAPVQRWSVANPQYSTQFYPR